MAVARRSVDGRLSGAQAELALQEESVRRSERERRATLDQVAALERSLQATESQLRASQVGRNQGSVGEETSSAPWWQPEPLSTGACASPLSLLSTRL